MQPAGAVHGSVPKQERVDDSGVSAARLSTATARDERLFEDFRERVGEDMELREEAVEDTDALESTSSPAELTLKRDALRAEIRRRRAGAKQGALLTPDIRIHFRELLAPVLEGERGGDVRF